jgi:hypothetical protein
VHDDGNGVGFKEGGQKRQRQEEVKGLPRRPSGRAVRPNVF